MPVNDEKERTGSCARFGSHRIAMCSFDTGNNVSMRPWVAFHDQLLKTGGEGERRRFCLAPPPPSHSGWSRFTFYHAVKHTLWSQLIKVPNKTNAMVKILKTRHIKGVRSSERWNVTTLPSFEYILKTQWNYTRFHILKL